MKKVLRSPILKGIAFLLCLVCLGMSIMAGLNGLAWFADEAYRGDMVYRFEPSFSESYMLNHNFRIGLDELDYALRNNASQQELDRVFAERFHGEYYAKMGDKILKNADLTKAAVQKSQHYLYIEPGNWESAISPVGVTLLDETLSNWVSEYDNRYSEEWRADKAAKRQVLQPGDCIMIRMTDEQVSALKSVWDSGRYMVNDTIKIVVIWMVALLIPFIYLLCVTGRSAADEEIHPLLIDRMFSEVNLLLIGGISLGTVVGVMLLLEEMLYSQNMIVAEWSMPMTLVAVCAFGIVLELILSLTRNLKNRSFVRRSLILSTALWCWKIIKKSWTKLIGLGKRSWSAVKRGKTSAWNSMLKNYKTRNVLLIFLGYSMLLGLLAMLVGALLYEGDAAFLLMFALGIAWFVAAGMFLLQRVNGFERVVDALKRLRNGDLSYKLTDMPNGVFASMADDINSLGDGMQMALQNEIHAERMKSELITNVSHDLKTPLTSILNYSDLLCQEHLSPEEANDYAKIIHQKGLRLKNLTSDLFDISKVQSGAEQLNCERLDVCTLVRQALGEQDKAIAESKLTLKLSMPEHEVAIWADGKKMSRVMENLIGNCVKYAMQGTRVFVSVKEQEARAEIEIKNMANYEMDFAADEITERFVRGDAARSTEGSGLGLAIAKSYVEACGGVLSVDVDGDLFKVKIDFPLYGLRV